MPHPLPYRSVPPDARISVIPAIALATRPQDGVALRGSPIRYAWRDGGLSFHFRVWRNVSLFIRPPKPSHRLAGPMKQLSCFNSNIACKGVADIGTFDQGYWQTTPHVRTLLISQVAQVPSSGTVWKDRGSPEGMVATPRSDHSLRHAEIVRRCYCASLRC
jgi:hypothetical protein